MSTKKRVLENSFLYTFSSLLINAVSFFLLPVYTLFLTPQDYGIVNLANNFIQVTIFAIAFSLYSAVVRFYADFKNDIEKVKRFYGTIVTFTGISGMVIVSLGLIFNEILISWFFDGISFYPAVFIILLSVTFFSLRNLHHSMLQGMQQGKKLTLINLIFFGLQVCLTLFFIGILKLGAIGVLLTTCLLNIGYFIYMVFDLKRNNLITFCIDVKILRAALAYSLPLIPHDSSTQIASFASRIFINVNGSLASVGLYSVASQFGALIDTVQSSVNRAFQPWFYEMMNKDNLNSKREVVNLSSFLLLLYSLVYLGIGLFSQEVIILMTNKGYILAWTIIPILVIAFSLKSIYYFYVNVLFYHKSAVRFIFIATIIGSFADIISAYMLVPKYGMYGAAISFLIAKMIVVTIVVLLSKRYDDIGYRVKGMLRIIISSIIFMGVGLYFSYTKYMTVFSWSNLFYKICIFLLYLIYAYLTNRKIIKKIVNTEKIQQVLKKKGKLKSKHSA
ncbi:polysaccharide biosynthesis C-terminal domain-containing protein [Bacillus paranthracis]|uniref:oligosaccharide flippase family protein n=1 Tax=Bacillus TaxID=1386 RepID=UPI0002796273|nr:MULTISPECIES: polysaccharide biosynthesis C-terminal domain-containing protein [Bacillus]EJR22199.1 hypothetical protein II9_00306 [Bacillus cereus MSX-D12]KMP46347.1 sugar lyase [Bacillus cereus]KMP64082.1 sugar lyase [Bacillus cereus]MBE7113892.1 oligosaccharide flippase family protein [Bacillus paranthracis]MBE7133076.1 oligosaccharide flippase family protein [Bacillus paranthracis]